MPRFVPLPAPLDDPLLDLQELVAAVHARMRRIEPSLGCIAVLIPGGTTEGLRLYLCHDPGAAVPPGGSPMPEPAAGMPESPRQARVVDDLLRDHDPGSAHDRWLLARGWRSTLTLPLRRRDHLQGFLLLSAGRAEAFGPEALEPLQPLLDLLLLRIGDHLGSIGDLRATLALLAEMVALRDPATGDHQLRVGAYSAVIARGLAHALSLPADFALRIARFAPLHDVGKVGIPDRILLKPGRLDPEERSLMRSHVAIGMVLIERMLASLNLSRDPAAQMLREVVAHHHELLDGSGYPQGLRGAQVSLVGRIVAVADIYDALTQERPYRQAMAAEAAAATLLAMAKAGKLDGRCVAALLEAPERQVIRCERLPALAIC